MPAERDGFRCGHVAIVGRPNVGKSTLLNHLVGQKISITSHKPQTTRHRILGISGLRGAQVIYVDTPGLHRRAKRAINRYMNRAAGQAIQDVDVVIFMIEALRWTDEDDLVMELVRSAAVPVILAVNKVDRVRDKARLLPFLELVAGKGRFDEVVPLSARGGHNRDTLEQSIVARLPVAAPLYPEEQVTDRSVRFMAAELIREKLFRKLGEEVPYRLSVEIEAFEEGSDMARINAVVWVERANQKAIVIGSQGRVLKAVGSEARRDLEQMLDKKVFLQTWVKIKENWSDEDRALRSLGYDE